MKARTAVAIAILLAVAVPVAMLAQSDSQSAPQGQQGQMGPMGGRQGQMGHMAGPPSAQTRLDHLSRMLNLTDDQKTKIKPILENEQSQMQSLRQDTSLSPQDRHTKMRDIREGSMTQIRAVLTPDQQSKLDSMRQNMGGRGKGMGPGQGMSPNKGQQQAPPPQI